ncbi:Conserved putative secreted protein [Criblamydia sequanensis CRIB-18]|uniref:Conserved putative secreted protein n=1 Tax=Candidatus Criblamydia sequanensis CRIB-18 TaxID=1437425 RepID=A0A090CZ12_9BACT|nr:Conserved putative secreted protein [Criblamydia sequanensis CRIB-18]
MKKFYQIAFVFCSILMTQYGYAQECCPSQNFGAPINNAPYDNGIVEQAACPPEQPTGEYWCLYAKYEPCYYNDWRCVEEPQIAFVFCSVLMTQYGYAECCPQQNYDNAPMVNDAQPYDNGIVEQAACPPEHPAGECWGLFVKYDPCYYNDWRCVEEPCTVQKKCCRMVPQYYQVQKCRYVPQYYSETCCKQVPEYYCVDQCYTKKRYVCDKKCRYVPRQKCRYVPQYYSETCCKQVPEYYCVDQCYTKKRWVCDKKCRYVPRYYYKKVCVPQGEQAPQGCAPQGSAPQFAPSCR